MTVWTRVDDIFAAIQTERDQTATQPAAFGKKKKKYI